VELGRHLAADQELEESVDGISEQALIEAAAELGVDISVVQQAAVEERLRREVTIGEVSPRPDAEDLESV
jgi:predicted ATPase